MRMSDLAATVYDTCTGASLVIDSLKTLWRPA